MALKAKVDEKYRKRGKTPPPSPDWVLPVEYYKANTSKLCQSIAEGENTVEVAIEE